MPPGTTALEDGGFIITWSSRYQDGDSSGIHAQRYDANGNNVGAEFQVNTYISSEQREPSITALADGGFVITWPSSQNGDSYEIYAQRYDANGNNLGTEFQVNTYISSGQFEPSITALADGGFVVAWASYNQDGDGYGIYAQRYDLEGNPFGVVTLNEIITNTPPTLTDFTMSDHAAIAMVNEDTYYEHNTSLHFTDADGDTLTYSATLADGSILPSWISMNTTIGILSGTPLDADVGAIDIIVTAIDNSGASVSDGYTLTVISSIDANVLTNVNNYLDNISLDYFKDGLDTGVSTLVEVGGISFDHALDFDAVKLSDPAAYNDTSSIQADDAVAILRDIVFLNIIETNTTTWHAADVNNDGRIAADDAVAILRHIVFLDEIDTFDLVDNTTGNRVTNLDPDAVLGEWIIVANGDVNSSGSFNDYYTVAVDIL